MLDRYVSPFRTFGPLYGLLYSVDRLLWRMSPALRLHCYDFVVQPVDARPLLPSRLSERFQVREIRRGDPELALMPARPDIREARYAQGAICLGVFRDGALAGYAWLAFGAYEEDEVRCTFIVHPPGAAVFDFDFYVFPEHRMTFAFPALWDAVYALLRQRHVRHTYSRVTRFNVASGRAHARLGARRVGSALFLKAWRMEVMAATVPPYVHASLREADRVSIALHPVADGGPADRPGGSDAADRDARH